jgi:archaellum biogenesis protein FlaJ (TadC family)
VDRFQEKPSGDKHETRTKTDTGRRGEKPQALERTVVKELGKLTPYVRKKGALLETEGAENRLWRLFIKNTALC